MRAPIGDRVALVGDAALATDPVWGVGCGWAVQTGEWPADPLAPWVRGERALHRSLRPTSATRARRGRRPR